MYRLPRKFQVTDTTAAAKALAMRTHHVPESIHRPSIVKTTTLTSSGGVFTAKKTANSRFPRSDLRALKVQHLFHTKLLQMPKTS